MSNKSPKNVVVLGMHRSGTSVVMNLLREAGFYIGSDEDLLRANEANRKGYGERFDVVNTNKRILESAGLDWMSANELDHTTISGTFKKEISEQIKEVVENLNQHGVWAIKDPRLCITLPLWKDQLSGVLIIICHRSPVEVAKSLQDRNGLPLSVGYALWEAYTKSLILNSEGYDRTVVVYQDLISAPEAEIKKLISWLSEQGCIGINQLDPQHIEKVIQPELHRQRSIDGEERLFDLEQFELLLNLREGVVPAITVQENSFDLSQEILALFNGRRDMAKKCKDIVKKNKDVLTDQQEQKKNRDDRVSELKKIVQKKENAISQQVEQNKLRNKRIIELKKIIQNKETTLRKKIIQNEALQEGINSVNNLAINLSHQFTSRFRFVTKRKDIVRLIKKIIDVTESKSSE